MRAELCSPPCLRYAEEAPHAPLLVATVWAALLAHESHADVGALQVLGELALKVGRLGGDGGRVVRVDLGWGWD